MRYDRNKHVGDTVYVPYNLEGKRNHKVYPSCHPDIFTTEPHVLGDSSKGEDPDYCALCGQIVAAKVLHSVDPYEKRFFAHDDAIADFNSSETSEEIHFLRSFDRTVSINKAGTVRLAEGKYITYMNVGDYDVTIWNDGKITNLNAYSSTTLRGSKTGTYGKITNRTEGGTVGDLLFRVNSNSAYYVTEDLQWISRAAASGSSISEVRVLYSPFTYIEITGDGVKAATDEADKYKLTALRGETVILDVATYSIQPAMNFPGSDSSITWDYGGIPDDHVHVDRNVDWKDLRLTITDLPSGTYTLTFTRTAVNKFSVSATLVLTVEETLTAHTVTFDPNGGTLSEGEMSSKSVFPGDAYGALPTPTRADYRFDGWFTEKDGGTKVEETTIMSSRAAHTLYAHWTPIHVHAYTQQVQKPEALKTPADCTNNAVYYLSCACGEVSTNDADTFTAANTALDHDWGAWTQNSDEKTHTRICKRDTSHTETENCHGGTATCTQRATCTVCGAEYGDALGHDFTTSWTHDDNEHWKQCSRCDAKDDVSPHTWDSGTVTTAPTCTKAGEETYSCTKCGATKIEPIPATGHSWKSDWTSDATHHWHECANENCDVTDNAGKKGYAEHSGGKATCTQNAVCEFCKASYGSPDQNNHTDLKHIDAKAATAAEEGNIAYWYCDGCKKYFSDKDGTKEIAKADTVTAKLPPKITAGDGAAVTQGEKKELSFTSDASFADFVRVELDGTALEEKNYTKREGSTIITLNRDFVATLSVGEHTLAIVSQHGTATAKFTVKAKPTETATPQPTVPPQPTAQPTPTVQPQPTVQPVSPILRTGDTANPALWFALLIVSGGAAIGITVASRKKKHNK